jgi:hypothetical protein
MHAAPRPSSPFQSSVIRIPSPTSTSRSSVSTPSAEDLESPRLGQAIASQSTLKRQSSKAGVVVGDASSKSGDSRSRSARPTHTPIQTGIQYNAAALGSAHAHSILHTCLIDGPPSPTKPSSLPSVSTATSLPPSTSPFRGFESPSMTSNEMQVGLQSGGEAVCFPFVFQLPFSLFLAVPLEPGDNSRWIRARPRGKMQPISTDLPPCLLVSALQMSAMLRLCLAFKHSKESMYSVIDSLTAKDGCISSRLDKRLGGGSARMLTKLSSDQISRNDKLLHSVQLTQTRSLRLSPAIVAVSNHLNRRPPPQTPPPYSYSSRLPPPTDSPPLTKLCVTL